MGLRDMLVIVRRAGEDGEAEAEDGAGDRLGQWPRKCRSGRKTPMRRGDARAEGETGALCACLGLSGEPPLHTTHRSLLLLATPQSASFAISQFLFSHPVRI